MLWGRITNPNPARQVRRYPLFCEINGELKNNLLAFRESLDACGLVIFHGIKRQRPAHDESGEAMWDDPEVISFADY